MSYYGYGHEQVFTGPGRKGLGNGRLMAEATQVSVTLDADAYPVGTYIVRIKELAQFLRLGSITSEMQGLLARYLRGARAHIEGYYDLQLVPATVVDDAPVGHRIRLTRRPVRSVTSIYTRSEEADVEDVTSRYKLDGARGYLELKSGEELPGTASANSGEDLRITYEAGWLKGQIPDDIVTAVMEWCSNQYNDDGGDPNVRHLLGPYLDYRAAT